MVENGSDYDIGSTQALALWSGSFVSEFLPLAGNPNKPQVQHQRRHGAEIGEGEKTKKAIGHKATWCLRHTCVRCSCSAPHGTLCGKAGDYFGLGGCHSGADVRCVRRGLLLASSATRTRASSSAVG